MSLENEYFDWLYNRVFDANDDRYLSYTRLLNYLHSRDYEYSIPMDSNRFNEGVSLRYRFGSENNIPQPVIASELDMRPCSVLEMMISLAMHCELEVMDDPEKGDRTAIWFWAMIDNMSLMDMYDGKFNREIVDNAVDKMLHHEYDSHGRGGLFAVKECKYDMRTIDVYHQAMLYLAEILRE